MLEQLQHWFSCPPAPSRTAEEDLLGLNSLAADIEECNWNALLDDMDRFSRTFTKA